MALSSSSWEGETLPRFERRCQAIRAAALTIRLHIGHRGTPTMSLSEGQRVTATQVVQVGRAETQCLVMLAGEIDHVSADDVGAIALAAITDVPDGTTAIVVDMSQVTFIDSAGLGALVQIRNAGEAQGLPTAIVGAPQHVVRIFGVTGVDTVFDA
jgi:anti-sigma B factor antagonist